MKTLTSGLIAVFFIMGIFVAPAKAGWALLDDFLIADVVAEKSVCVIPPMDICDFDIGWYGEERPYYPWDLLIDDMDELREKRDRMVYAYDPLQISTTPPLVAMLSDRMVETSPPPIFQDRPFFQSDFFSEGFSAWQALAEK